MRAGRLLGRESFSLATHRKSKNVSSGRVNGWVAALVLGAAFLIPTTSIQAQGTDGGFIAGTQPDRRPDSAPTITQFEKNPLGTVML